MNLRYQANCENIDWDRIVQLLKEGEMSTASPEIHELSFQRSYSVIFVFDEDKLIGAGRLLSDGFRQSAIYDIVVDSSYQGNSIGKEIVSRLIQSTPNCNFILYASQGKEGFYQALGFKKMKTGMALFSDPNRMEDGVFVEP